MKTILYMAVTLNGMIAKKDDNTNFVLRGSWKNYKKIVRNVDAVIVGRRTYETMPRSEFERGPLYVVLSRKSLKRKVSDVVFMPRLKTIIRYLEEKGYTKVLVAGGGKTNGSFLKAGLIDEIFLDIEPTVFGKGIRLFGETDFEKKLKLLGVKKFSKDEVQLHYKVLK